MSYYGAGGTGGTAGGGGGFYGDYGQGGYPQQQQQQQQNAYNGGFGGPDVQQWQTSHQQQYSSSQPQQQQQQSNATPAFWNPATAAAVSAVAGSFTGAAGGAGGAGGILSSDAMFNIGSDAAKKFFDSSWARMIPGLESGMLSLRGYFAVDNQYVLRKMQKIVFPFRSKVWKRMKRDPKPDGSTTFELPTYDENAPDLYLPCMSLITYVLLCALCYGNAGKFEPEVIPDVTSKCFMTQVLEVLVIRLGFYLMQAPVSFLDLFSYTGYKYLGLSINMLVGLLSGHFGFGARGYYAFFLWTASACSYFMLKSMANNIPMETAPTGPPREVMVVAIGASQFASMWFLSQTKNL